MNPDEEAQLVADINGERGPEQQLYAEQWAEENGYDVIEAVPEETLDDAFYREATNQILQMEEAEGRPFSQKEIADMVDFHGESDQVPDMAYAYEQAVGRDMRNKDDRQAAATEVYLEHQAEMAGEEE